MPSDPPSNVFKETWNLQFSDWREADVEEEGGPTGRRFHIVGWIRQKARSLKRQEPEKEKEPVPPIKETPTLSFSDSGENGENDNEIETKILGSPLTWCIRWFNNRNRFQKAIYAIGAVIFLIIMLSIIVVLSKNSSEEPSSNSVLNEGFSFPDFLSTESPSGPFEIPESVTSPPTTIAPNTTSPTNPPSAIPQQSNTTYVPGNLETLKYGLLLSEGLDAKILAFSDEKVTFDLDGGGKSKDRFHKFPDAGATFPDERDGNQGGWIYVSNSEVPNKKGGVGALTFDKEGNLIDYEILLKGTSMNCGGGETPWGTWVSCEENGDEGRIYQVSPTDERKPEVMSLGSGGGNWESFAYDVRDQSTPRFFVTEDKLRGALQRFVPDSPNWDEPWDMLHGNGKTDYLMLVPNSTNDGGMFVWTSDEEASRSNAELYYPETEGIDVKGSKMYFVCKTIKQLFVLDLDAGSYYNETTLIGLFDGSPDQVEHLLSPSQDLLYFTEEGGNERNAGVHARDGQGRYYTVFESQLYEDETTGLSFSPDGQFMYVAYQGTGLLFAIWRTDGHPFHAAHLDVKYHSSLVP